MPHHKVQKNYLNKGSKTQHTNLFQEHHVLAEFRSPIRVSGGWQLRVTKSTCEWTFEIVAPFFLLETQWSQCGKKTWKNTFVSDPWISPNHCRKVAVVKLLEQMAGTAGNKWKQRVLCQTLSLHSMSQTMIKQKTEQECFNFNRHIQKKHKMSQATKYVKSTFEA